MWGRMMALASADICGVKGVSAWAFICNFFSFFLSFFFFIQTLLSFRKWLFPAVSSLPAVLSCMCGCTVRQPQSVVLRSRPHRFERNLVVRSTGICSERSMCSLLPRVCLCALTYSIVVFPFYGIISMRICICLHSAIHAPIWRMPRHSDPLRDFCHFKHPLLQRSVTEHLLYSDLLMSETTRERRNEEQKEEKNFMGLLFFLLQRCHLCCVKRCKAVSLSGNLRLTLISIVITLQTQKISSALAIGSIHPNMTPLFTHTQETVLAAHEPSIYHFPYWVKKYKWVSP